MASTRVVMLVICTISLPPLQIHISAFWFQLSCWPTFSITETPKKLWLQMLLSIKKLFKARKRKREEEEERKNREGLLRVSCTIASNLFCQFHFFSFSFCFTSKKGQIHFNEKSTCLNSTTLSPHESSGWFFLSSTDLWNKKQIFLKLLYNLQ